MMNTRAKSKGEADSHTNETQRCVKLTDSWNLLPCLGGKPYNDLKAPLWLTGACRSVMWSAQSLGGWQYVYIPVLKHNLSNNIG